MAFVEGEMSRRARIFSEGSGSHRSIDPRLPGSFGRETELGSGSGSASESFAGFPPFLPRRVRPWLLAPSILVPLLLVVLVVVIMHAIIMLGTCHRALDISRCCTALCGTLDSGELGSRDFLYRILKCASNRGPRCILIESLRRPLPP